MGLSGFAPRRQAPAPSHLIIGGLPTEATLAQARRKLKEVFDRDGSEIAAVGLCRIAWARSASLIETCKINGIEPFAYLKATLTAIANGHPQSRLDDLLPWNFKPSIQAASDPQRTLTVQHGLRRQNASCDDTASSVARYQCFLWHFSAVGGAGSA